MSVFAKITRWPLLILSASFTCLSACSSISPAIQGKAPSKATIQPTETIAVGSPNPTRESKATETPEECEELEGRLIEDTYPLPNGSNSAPFIAYLPPCYVDHVETDYPVGYLLHGYPQDEQHWIELGVIESYEQLLSAGQVDPMIWIIPYQPEPYFTQSDGGPGSLEEVLLQDLLSAVNARYRISTSPGDHAILGVSRGGVWALEIGMRHPDQFDIIAALSPALAFNHPRRAYDPFEIVRSTDELPEYILISSGDREPRFSGEIDQFVQVLEEVQVIYFHLQHEGRHEDAAWEGIMNQVLLFVSEAIRENRTHVLD